MPQHDSHGSGDAKQIELTSLAHDFRSSLHALRMGRELLRQLQPDPSILEVCDAMDIEERKVGEMLERLLAIARGNQ
jgi:hypothetical protein